MTENGLIDKVNCMNKIYNILHDLENYLNFQKTLGVRGVINPREKISDQQKQAEAPKETLMELLRKEMGNCTRCKLRPTRKNLVFGTGNLYSELVFVGEAPGADEDIQGEPFVGKAGMLLTKIIQSMGYDRKEVYIANIIKCRPPNNRNPETDEIQQCEPFLIKQLSILKPKVICALGTFAAQTLLKTQERISLLRGKFHSYQGIKVMPTYHPAYLLRNPSEKRSVWEDVKLVMKELGKKIN